METRSRGRVGQMVDLDAFATDGHPTVERATPRAVADDARAALWAQLGHSPDAPERWPAAVPGASDTTGARGASGQVRGAAGRARDGGAR
ncbi:hypothetical protein [Mycolicibacterium hodleri]|uniref:hypothetical protein n=1 Tax=Mycolicibacterium hodleri TaxID=49897 RepID=UPI001129B413|nr:hypothetical protein [Mycolicibacterium hodleri]